MLLNTFHAVHGTSLGLDWKRSACWPGTPEPWQESIEPPIRACFLWFEVEDLRVRFIHAALHWLSSAELILLHTGKRSSLLGYLQPKLCPHTTSAALWPVDWCSQVTW